METIGVVGVAFRRDGSDVLSRFTIPKEDRVDRLPDLARQLQGRNLAVSDLCNQIVHSLETERFDHPFHVLGFYQGIKVQFELSEDLGLDASAF